MNKIAVKIILRKYGEMVYFSQLDILHILERSLRRTNLPVFFTQGFNPHIKISFFTGLKLGVEGKIEAALYFTREVTLSELSKQLTPQLPQGLELI